MFAHADRAWQTPWVSIACLCIDFHLSGCRSLKDKRQRLSGLRDRFGRNPNLAVFESEGADDHARAQWTFVAAAASARVVERAAPHTRPAERGPLRRQSSRYTRLQVAAPAISASTTGRHAAWPANLRSLNTRNGARARSSA